MAETKKAPVTKKKSMKSMSFISLFMTIVMALLAVFLLPTTIVIVLGMIPTAVAFFVDTSREKNLGPTILCLNFAGVFPALFKLWKSSHTVNHAIDLMMDPTVMLMILLSSGFGWLLYLYIPPLVGTVMRKRGDSRIRQLEKNQEELVEQWSTSIIKTPPGSEHIKAEKEDIKPTVVESSVSA